MSTASCSTRPRLSAREPAPARRLERRESWWIGALAYAAYAALRLLRWTIRTEIVGAADIPERVRRGEPAIVAFWHDQLLGMPMVYRGGPLHLLISRHRDGEIATRCLERLGMVAVRGSSTRGWMAALRGLLGALRSGSAVVVVPDGPRGPRHRAKLGPVQLARATGAEIVPVGLHARPRLRVGSWDRMLVPVPFGRLRFVQGHSIRVARDASRDEMELARVRLEEELGRVSRLAQGAVRRARRGGRMALACYRGTMNGFAAAVRGVGRLTGWRREELNERLGRYGEEMLRRVAGRACIWLHAASVGEMQGVRALVGPLRQRFPEAAIVVSALTRTGRTAAQRLPGVDAGIFLPFDAPSVIQRALSTLRPRAFLFTETELWPSMLLECAARGIPAVLVSGRLSERSVRRYLWLRPVMERTLGAVTLCVQSEADARRLVTIGAAPERVSVAGNLKAEAPVDEEARRRIGRILRASAAGTRDLLVGASTHRGEEEALLSAFCEVEARYPTLRLVLAPRHPERFAEVAALLERFSRPWVRFGDLERAERPLAEERILLLDRMGLLRGCLPHARLVFVGGTLAPIGGHSLLEPAAEGCAVVFGPHTEHVAELAQTLLDCGGARRVSDAAALAHVVETLGADAAAAARAGALAAAAVAAERGALARHLEILLPRMASSSGGECDAGRDQSRGDGDVERAAGARGDM